MNSKYKYLKYKKKYLELKGGSGFNKYLTEAHHNNDYLTCKDHILTYLRYLKSPNNNINFTITSLYNKYQIEDDIRYKIIFNFNIEKDVSPTLALIPVEKKFLFYRYSTICRFSELINKYYPENPENLENQPKKTIDSTVLNNIFINTILFNLPIDDDNYQDKINKIIDDQKFLIKYINLKQTPLIMELVREKFYSEQLNNTVIIPKIDNINTIPDNFLRDGELQTVIIPNTIIQISNYAFDNNKITRLTIPNSVIEIGKYAFHNNHITRLTIGNSVTQIGDYAFAFNVITTRRTPLIIPDSVTEIGNFAFANNQITKLTIGNSVTKIYDNAFYNNKIRKLTIPDSVTKIGKSAFARNQITATITSPLIIPYYVTEIGDYAFDNNRIKKYRKMNSTTYISPSAFEDQMTESPIVETPHQRKMRHYHLQGDDQFDYKYMLKEDDESDDDDQPDDRYDWY